jgi:hypothetical protein
VHHVTANYAFETKLRGKYTPVDFSIVLEQISSAVEVARNGFVSFWDKLNTKE